MKYMRRKAFGRKHRPKDKKKDRLMLRIKLSLTFILLIFTISYAMNQFDKKIMPSVIAAADMRAKTQMNIAINNALKRIMDERNVKAEDFYINTIGDGGNVKSLSVNTVLTNDICNSAAVLISQELSAIAGEKISIPIGAIMGIDVFANTGPKYQFTVMPVGNAIVDYQSSIESAGINQLLFQVNLNVETSVQIVNPLQSTEVVVSRIVPLVNAVISQDVPSSYWTIQSPAVEGSGF